MQTYYAYDDVCLIPQKSDYETRNSANTSQNFASYLNLDVPIISSNMDTVTGIDMAIAMWKVGGLGALHRFMSIKENITSYEKIRESGCECLVSIGVNGDSVERANCLYESGARYFVIDVAHGHSSLVEKMSKRMKDMYGNIILVSGNVATPEGVRDLCLWGANAVKIGISSGAACSTRIITGHGLPMFSCLLSCSPIADEYGVQIIADGGIKSSGDMMKAFTAGADFVMIGSLLAGTDESLGISESFIDDKTGNISYYKSYRGMASNEAMKDNRRTNCPAAEGISGFVPVKGCVKDTIENLIKGIKSGMSYCNATSISDIHTRAKWALQTPSGHLEGLPRLMMME